MAISALESLASQSHQQAEKAIVVAGNKLSEPLDQKMQELNDFRSQVKSQSKNLRHLITSCESRATRLDKFSASPAQLAKSRNVQMEIEVLNRHIRVVEKAKQLREIHATKD